MWRENVAAASSDLSTGMWIEQNNEEMQHTMNEAEAH
jgi:hypothetical protein